MDKSWLNSKQGQETFLFYKSIQIHSWAYPTSYAMDNGILSLGVECLECGADPLHPSNAEING